MALTARKCALKSMLSEILPPENVAPAGTPQIKLRHLPVALLYLGGSLGAVGLLSFGAILVEAAAALLAFLFIAALILLVAAAVVVAACRKRTYSNCS